MSNHEVEQADPPRKQSIEMEPIEGQPEIPLQSIVNEINNEEGIGEVERKSVPVPVVKNPVYFYKGHEKYQWKLQELDETACIEALEVEVSSEKEEEDEESIQIKVIQAKTENKHAQYYVGGRDKAGDFEFHHRYSEFIELRNKLIELWPGVMLPELPNGPIGTTDEVSVRTKFINYFLSAIAAITPVYYSDEVKKFVYGGSDEDIVVYLKSVQAPKLSELTEKYKTLFPDAYQTSMKEQFMYRRDQIPQLLVEFEGYFLKKKITLSEYKDSFRRLAEAKTRYYKAMSKLDQVLLPDYEDVLLKWFNGTPLKADEPGIMQRNSRKEEQSKKAKQQSKPEDEGKPQEEPKLQSEQSNPSGGLYSSEAYRSRFEDTAAQIQNYNEPTWLLYDVIKSELKDIDMVASAIEQVKTVQRELEYLKRSISINKEQVEALNNKKTTLKTFFMGGSEDDKKAKLTNESQIFEEKLEKITELYHIILVLFEEQLNKYHKQRAEQYRKNLKKALKDDLSIAKSIMQFHVYESQLFGKQRVRKIKQLVGEPQDEGSRQEEIKQEQ